MSKLFQQMKEFWRKISADDGITYSNCSMSVDIKEVMKDPRIIRQLKEMQRIWRENVKK